MLLLALVVTWVWGVGGVSSTCPAVCRCDGVGTMQRVDCVDAGLRSVPPHLSGLTSSLDVSVNKLSKLSSNVFRRLRHLRELTLQNNHLKTVSPEAFGGLKNLRSLRLDANFISRLPASSFRGLSSLRHLWLDDNVLTEVPVLALSVLTELQALTLAFNNISSIPDRAFASLRQLLVLHLHGNCILSVSRKSFEGLHSLETLDLSFNRIDSFPSAITHLRHLRELNLQSNNIQIVPGHAFSGNPSIETINIRNNPLHSLRHSSFQLLPKLQTLDLSFNRIDSFPSAITHLRHLRELVSELPVSIRLSLFLRCETSSDSLDFSSLSTCGLGLSVSLLFVVSIVFSLLLLLSLLPPLGASSLSTSDSLLPASSHPEGPAQRRIQDVDSSLLP